MLASSGGSVNRTSSRIKSRSRWSVKPCSGKAITDLLDENFRSGSTGGQTNALHAFEPLRIDVGRRVDKLSFNAAALRDFHETIRVRATFCEPTTRNQSTSCATCSTVPGGFCVA